MPLVPFFLEAFMALVVMRRRRRTMIFGSFGVFVFMSKWVAWRAIFRRWVVLPFFFFFFVFASSLMASMVMSEWEFHGVLMVF